MTAVRRTELSPRFREALDFAARVHDGQWRKDGPVPYVAHVLGVTALVLEGGGSEAEAIAALLHDAAEDHGGRPMLEEIERRFGPEVARVVEECSDELDGSGSPWRQRKEGYLQHLEEASPAALRVSLADKVYNSRAILGDYRTYGPALWRRFGRSAGEQLWYFTSLQAIFDRVAPGPMADEFGRTVAELERMVAEQEGVTRPFG